MARTKSREEKEGGAVKGHGNTEATASRSQPLHGALVLAKDDAGYVGGMMKVAFFGLVGAAVPSVLHLHQPRPVEGRVGHNNRAVHQGNANLWVAPRLLPQLENARDETTTLAMAYRNLDLMTKSRRAHKVRVRGVSHHSTAPSS